jgi:hypothetical protein
MLIPLWDIGECIPSSTRDLVKREAEAFQKECTEEYADLNDVYRLDIAKVYFAAGKLNGRFPSLVDAFEFSTRVDELRGLFSMYDAKRTVGSH